MNTSAQTDGQAVELDSRYNHRDFEGRIYTMWRDGGYFNPDAAHTQRTGDAQPEAAPFVIVIPPPNVTGVLHLGHGLNNSLQDIVVRYWRMKGRRTLWVPGSDHAGIATQHVVERELAAHGRSRREIGRRQFEAETWKVKERHHTQIRTQLEKIGVSCDWSRERFTMDSGLSQAVREAFVTLYEEGLIYRGTYLVNWCSKCGTALSDDEVEHKETNGRLYRFRYPLAAQDSEFGAATGVGADSGGGKIQANVRNAARDGADETRYIEIVTTRPETMLGDTAVAVHPEDARYSGLVGRIVLLPLAERPIPIVADDYIDREFGSGALKVTPAHDQNDWEIGKRHNLQMIAILDEAGRLNDAVPERYRGLTVSEARARVVADMQAAGLAVDEVKHRHQVGHCYRCGTVIEPRLSEQWFVQMRPLAEQALEALQKEEIRFFPRHWENTYRNWMENIRDWCISRQLWWGHRIPVWYDRQNGEMIVSRDDPTLHPENSGRRLVQDEDVLDTWFSSWLWPFSVLGWPTQTADTEGDMKRFYPTTALITGYDIIFFWVARMVMAGKHFTGRTPFRDICLTSLIRDKKGRKMAKSLGNGIDPLEIVQDFGADALRFSLAYAASGSQDILIDRNDFQMGSRFANKIWNAARYVIMSLPDSPQPLPDPHSQRRAPIDCWIHWRLNRTIARVEQAMQTYRFNDGAHAVYEYFWNDFCDWYVEISKLKTYRGTDDQRPFVASLLIDLLQRSLRLLHPFMPFISEELYQKLPSLPGDKRPASVMIADYPQAEPLTPEQLESAEHFDTLQEIVRRVRTFRSEFSIAPGAHIEELYLHHTRDFAPAGLIHAYMDIVGYLGKVEKITVSNAAPPELGKVIKIIGSGYEMYIVYGTHIDVVAQTARIYTQLAGVQKACAKTQARLANRGFLANADPAVVRREQEKLTRLEQQQRALEHYVAQLSEE